MNVRDLRPDGRPLVRAIYEDGTRSGDATFETEAPTWEAWDAAHPELRLIAEPDGSAAGRDARGGGVGRDVLLLERRSSIVG